MEPLLKQLETTNQDIKEELKQLSKKDYHNPNLVGLRRLNHFCSKRVLETTNKDERFLCFYIAQFIESFFSNLGGDAPYDKELQRVRISIIEAIQVSLDNLIKSIMEDNHKEILSALAGLVDNYIDKINHLNKVPCP